jgi:ubiquitin-like-conjugating enzyme ATG3
VDDWNFHHILHIHVEYSVMLLNEKKNIKPRAMASLGHKVFQAFHDVADRVMPTQTGSNFLEKGMLTPEEFVLAGDQLVHTCATWEWCGGDPAKARPYMPKDKQYLVTRGVPSLQRARSIQDAADADASEMVGDEGGGGAEDEWVVAGDAFTRLSRSADGGGGSAAEDEFEDVPSTSSGGGGGGGGSFVAAAALGDAMAAFARGDGVPVRSCSFSERSAAAIACDDMSAV